jgi:hypothetical protein
VESIAKKLTSSADFVTIYAEKSTANLANFFSCFLL